MKKLNLTPILSVFFTLNLTNGWKTHVFSVEKRLENGDAIPASLRSQVIISCTSYYDLLITVDIPPVAIGVNVYLANEVKNILQLDLSGPTLIGYMYETPFGRKETVTGPYIEQGNQGLITCIPRKWIPVNVTRISASVRTKDDIYNYYGIFNRAISIEDTMVVEEFKKVKLC